MSFRRICDITAAIEFHRGRIALHQSAINRLRKEKSLLMAKGIERTEMRKNAEDNVSAED